MNYGMGSVIQKYLNSLKKISSNFPNHNLELQIEINEPAPNPPVVPMRRMFRRYKQPNLRRSGNEINTINRESKVVTTQPMTITTTVYTPASSTTVMTPTITHIKTQGTTLNPHEKPIYREDLQKALEEIEKKISSIHITTGCKGNHPVQTIACSTYSTLPTTGYIMNRNIESIVELLRRGVHVETHVDKPSDENLDWLQIKIPNNV